MADSTGMADLRAENVSPVVVGFALQSYVLKQLCMVQSSNAWKETYFQETAADLTGGTGAAVEQVPRLARFPYGEVSWTEQSSRNKKHAMEGVISYEDKKTNDVDVIARTLLRIARAVAKSVDAEIWDVISESRTGSSTNKVTIPAGEEWDSPTIHNRDPIDNILNAEQLMVEDNYDPYSNGYLLLNPKDYRNLLGNPNVRNAGQFWSSDVTKNGKVGKLLGLTILVSNSITADWAAVVIKNEACTWKSVVGLTVKSIEDPGVKTTIRAWEIGCAQLKNPNAVCLISNTAA